MVRYYSRNRQIKNHLIFLLFLISTVCFSQKQTVIVIDAGHGGKDPGAIGKFFKTKEKNVNLGVANELYFLLKKNPKFHPIQTRNDDTFIPLEKRAEISNYFKPDLFISIHCNQPGTTNNFHSNGTEVYYLINNKVKNIENQRQSILIAYKVLKGLETSLKFSKRKILPQNFSVLRNTNKVSPSILVEVAFLSNYDDENYIKQAEKQKIIALSIYNTMNKIY